MVLSNCENQSKGVVQLQKDNIKRASEIHEIIIIYRKCCSNQVLNVDRELRPYQYSLVKKKNLPSTSLLFLRRSQCQLTLLKRKGQQMPDTKTEKYHSCEI